MKHWGLLWEGGQPFYSVCYVSLWESNIHTHALSTHSIIPFIFPFRVGESGRRAEVCSSGNGLQIISSQSHQLNVCKMHMCTYLGFVFQCERYRQHWKLMGQSLHWLTHKSL